MGSYMGKKPVSEYHIVSIYLLTEISNAGTRPKSLRICLCNSYYWRIQLLLPTEHETAAENTLQLYRR